jgi:hypothetical protein
MLLRPTNDGSDDDHHGDTKHRVVMTELLLEKTPAEWTPVYFQAFKDRIHRLECWIAEQPERNIVLVGHSQFFKAMLGLNFKFGNCEVWKVDFDPSMSQPTAAADVANSRSNTTITITSAVAVTEVDKKMSSTPLSTTTPAVGRQDSTDSGCQLPPQWSNLQQVFSCEVASSSKTP